jgi:hypothetical protein
VEEVGQEVSPTQRQVAVEELVECLWVLSPLFLISHTLSLLEQAVLQVQAHREIILMVVIQYFVI